MDIAAQAGTYGDCQARVNVCSVKMTNECRSMAPGSDRVVTLPEDTIWIDVRSQSNGALLEMVSAQTLKDFIVIMGSLPNQRPSRYQLCDGKASGRGGEASTGGFGPGGGSPRCHCLNSVTDLDRLLANRDVNWSLMVDLELDVESELESRLAAALFDAAPPDGVGERKMFSSESS